ncbi:unnamed protein product [Sphagnum tenellum]
MLGNRHLPFWRSGLLHDEAVGGKPRTRPVPACCRHRDPASELPSDWFRGRARRRLLRHPSQSRPRQQLQILDFKVESFSFLNISSSRRWTSFDKDEKEDVFASLGFHDAWCQLDETAFKRQPNIFKRLPDVDPQSYTYTSTYSRYLYSRYLYPRYLYSMDGKDGASAYMVGNDGSSSISGSSGSMALGASASRAGWEGPEAMIYDVLESFVGSGLAKATAGILVAAFAVCAKRCCARVGRGVAKVGRGGARFATAARRALRRRPRIRQSQINLAVSDFIVANSGVGQASVEGAAANAAAAGPQSKPSAPPLEEAGDDSDFHDASDVAVGNSMA